MSSLKVSLARLGLVTLTAGALASPALADFSGFSPLEQPLEGDFFISTEVGGLSFGSGDADKSITDKLKDADKSLLIGSNLFQNGSVVSGIFGNLSVADPFKTSPVGLGGYLAYQNVAEDGTGLKLGATLAYEAKFGALTINDKDASTAVATAKTELAAAQSAHTAASDLVEDAAADSDTEIQAEKTASEAVDAAKATVADAEFDHTLAIEGGAIAARLFGSYALQVGQVGGSPVLLTHAAALNAKKVVGKKDANGKAVKGPDVVLGFEGEVVAETQFDQLSPSLTVEVKKASLKQFKAGDANPEDAKTDLAITAGAEFQATENVVLEFGLGAKKSFFDKTAKADLEKTDPGKETVKKASEFKFTLGGGLTLLASEGTELGLSVEKEMSAKGFKAGLGLDLLF